MNNKFEVIFLVNAVEFLESIDEKSRQKIDFNIRKAQIIKDNELYFNKKIKIS